MYCETCISAKVTLNPFTYDYSNFQNSTLMRDQYSQVHITALKTLQMRSNFFNARSSADNVKDKQCSAKLENYAK